MIARAIAAELLDGGATPEVGLSADGSRIILETVPVAVDRGPLPVGPSDVIVVSGGGRGVTAAAIVELAKASSATFVLLGRSHVGPDPHPSAVDDAALKRVVLDEATAEGRNVTPAELGEQVGEIVASRQIRHTIASIEGAGGRALYLAVDIGDAAQVEDAFARIRAEVGPISGVVHGAGVLADKLIADKSLDQFDRVFAPKVIGLRNLLSAARDDRLGVLCLFSSVAAVTGNLGQADYAMANEVLNKVAISEHSATRRRMRREIARVGALGGRDGHTGPRTTLRVDRCRPDRPRRRSPHVRRRTREPSDRPGRGRPRRRSARPSGTGGAGPTGQRVIPLRS